MEEYIKQFKEYKEFIEKNSQYDVKVVKKYTNNTPNFPIIAFALSNYTNSNNCTLDKLEYYDNYYYTIDIFTKDKIINQKKVASEVINNELVDLTIKYFNQKNMYRTACRPVPNLDTDILRTNIQYQTLVGNSLRLNNIRR